MNPHDVHDLGVAIKADGVAWLFLNIAVDIVPETKQRAYEFNETQVAAADGLLAPIIPDSLEKLSLSSGHGNQFLRAANHGCRSEEPSVSRNGKLSAAKIAEDDDQFGKALGEGLDWITIPQSFIDEHPWLPVRIQAALNATNQAGKLTHEVEIGWRIINLVREKKPSTATEWTRIDTIASKGRPPCETYTPTIREFVRKHAGGIDGKLFKMASQFLKSEVGSIRRALGPSPKG